MIPEELKMIQDALQQSKNFFKAEVDLCEHLDIRPTFVHQVKEEILPKLDAALKLCVKTNI